MCSATNRRIRTPERWNWRGSTWVPTNSAPFLTGPCRWFATQTMTRNDMTIWEAARMAASIVCRVLLLVAAAFVTVALVVSGHLGWAFVAGSILSWAAITFLTWVSEQ